MKNDEILEESKNKKKKKKKERERIYGHILRLNILTNQRVLKKCMYFNVNKSSLKISAFFDIIISKQKNHISTAKMKGKQLI